MTKQKKLEISKFSFLHDQVLVKAIRDDVGKNGLIRAEQYEDKPEFGTVISVGNGKMLETGERVEPSVKPGDVIFFGKYSTIQTSSDGEDYYIIRDEDILAVL